MNLVKVNTCEDDYYPNNLIDNSALELIIRSPNAISTYILKFILDKCKLSAAEDAPTFELDKCKLIPSDLVVKDLIDSRDDDLKGELENDDSFDALFAVWGFCFFFGGEGNGGGGRQERALNFTTSG